MDVMVPEEEKKLVLELRTAYISLVRACTCCKSLDRDEKKNLFRLKEEVCNAFIQHYAAYRSRADGAQDEAP